MKRYWLFITFGFVSTCAFAGDSYEQEGIGYSQDSVAACSDALSYIKKQALVSYGAIMPAAESSGATSGKDMTDKIAPSDVDQIADKFLKVVNKDEVSRKDKRGNFVCTVKAKLEADVGAIIKRNLGYKGKLPAWVVVPPEAAGKIAVIEKSETLDGAIARTLHSYAERLVGEQERIRQIEELLAGNAKPYIRDIQITPEIRVKWSRKYYFLGDKLNPLFIHTFVEQTIFSNKGKVRHISSYREIESENGFASNFEDESSGETKGRLNINKAGASLQMLLDSLKNNGFEVQYAPVVAANKHTTWYALLVGNGKKASPL